jgi:multidrug efflux pump subunit AcrB
MFAIVLIVPQGVVLLLRRRFTALRPRWLRLVTLELRRIGRPVTRLVGGIESCLVRVGSALGRGSRVFLGWCLRNRFESLVLFVVLLSTSGWAWSKIPISEGTEQGKGHLEFRLGLPKSLTLYEAQEIFKKFEAAFDARRDDLKIDSITAWFDSSHGELDLFFAPGVRIKAEEFFNEQKENMPKIPGVSFRLSGDMFSDDNWGKRLRVFLRGPDLDMLYATGDLIEKELSDTRRFPELDDVRMRRDDVRDEVRVIVQRELAQHYDVGARTISRMVSWAIRGAALPDYETEDRELPFWIRYDDSDKDSIEDLGSVLIYRPSGDPYDSRTSRPTTSTQARGRFDESMAR